MPDCMPLLAVCDFTMGQSPSSDTYNTNGDGMPFYQGNADFGKRSPSPRVWCNSPKKTANEGDILISVRAPIGAINIAAEQCCIGRGLAALAVRPDAATRDYLEHYLRYKRPELERRGTGSTFKAVGKKVFAEMTLPIVSVDEQSEIAKKLNNALELQEEAASQISMLDELVKSRFIEMFGDPIENPFGWDTKPLGELGELKNGVNFKSVDSGTEIRCLGVGDFKDRYQISDMDLISIVSLNGKPNENQMLRDGDIVFVRSNGNKQLVGRCLAVFPGDEEVTFSGFCIRFRNESDGLLLDYLLGCLKSDSMRKAMTGRGANIQNLSQKILSGVVMPMPPIALQQEFAAFVQKVDKLKFETQQAIEKLQLLYDSLAQEYFGS